MKGVIFIIFIIIILLVRLCVRSFITLAWSVRTVIFEEQVKSGSVKTSGYATKWPSP